MAIKMGKMYTGPKTAKPKKIKIIWVKLVYIFIFIFLFIEHKIF